MGWRDDLSGRFFGQGLRPHGGTVAHYQKKPCNDTMSLIDVVETFEPRYDYVDTLCRLGGPTIPGSRDPLYRDKNLNS